MAKENKSRYALLGMLSIRPGSGYDIKKFMEQSTSNFWHESYGQIYPLLKQLVDEGLATSHTEKQEGKPERYIYTLTNKGLEELRQWPDLGISRHFGQIPQPLRIQPLQEGRGIAIPLVAHHPTGWDPLRGYDLLTQLCPQSAFGLKRQVFGSPAILPQCPVILTKPGLRQIETPVK